MGKNSREGNRERAARRREALAERGIKQVLLLAPEQAHPLLKQAVGFMTHESDPMEPRAALRRAGGSNEPAGDRITLAVELASARIEIEAAEQQKNALQAERDAARAAEACALAEMMSEREKAQAITWEASDAQKRAAEALQRAMKAETTIHRAKSLPGIRGRVVRWLAGDVLD
jgi:hypothetical protein